MKDYYPDFSSDVVAYFNTGSTVRATAKHFTEKGYPISPITVYRYITKLHPNETSELVLQKNKSERHIRGGQAMKNKYLQMRITC